MGASRRRSAAWTCDGWFGCKLPARASGGEPWRWSWMAHGRYEYAEATSIMLAALLRQLLNSWGRSDGGTEDPPGERGSISASPGAPAPLAHSEARGFRTTRCEPPREKATGETPGRQSPAPPCGEDATRRMVSPGESEARVPHAGTPTHQGSRETKHSWRNAPTFPLTEVQMGTTMCLRQGGS